MFLNCFPWPVPERGIVFETIRVFWRISRLRREKWGFELFRKIFDGESLPKGGLLGEFFGAGVLLIAWEESSRRGGIGAMGEMVVWGSHCVTASLGLGVGRRALVIVEGCVAMGGMSL